MAKKTTPKKTLPKVLTVFSTYKVSLGKKLIKNDVEKHISTGRRNVVLSNDADKKFVNKKQKKKVLLIRKIKK
jgi:hypothetical protein